MDVLNLVKSFAELSEGGSNAETITCANIKVFSDIGPNRSLRIIWQHTRTQNIIASSCVSHGSRFLAFPRSTDAPADPIRDLPRRRGAGAGSACAVASAAMYQFCCSVEVHPLHASAPPRCALSDRTCTASLLSPPPTLLLGRPRQPYAARVTGTLAALALAVDLNLTGRTRRRQSARSRVTASSYGSLCFVHSTPKPFSRHMRYTAATVYPDCAIPARRSPLAARLPPSTVCLRNAQDTARRPPPARAPRLSRAAPLTFSPPRTQTPPHPPNPVHTAALEAALQALTALAALRTAPDAAGWYETRPHAHVQEAVLTNRLTSAALYNPGRIAVLPLVCVWRDERTVVVFVHLVLTAAMDAATADCEARDDPCE
ncbi:hypothetical protein GGX14DRAFT_662359 [Mycena pura]|uniref:Uncharacterized protein n=1 Tax=Mycena pura TaxID=153505 RepID=A0AAD6V3Z2_9AGAR|nr:hypothetical protein GGX14DRAFT_662359 [Mycena pura]